MQAQLKVTRTVYTVRDFVSWYDQNQLELRPPFQRLDVWQPIAKSFLIDTILKGLPVPIIILRDRPGVSFTPKREVVDGQQRLTTILSFVCPHHFPPEKHFTISSAHASEFSGKSFAELPEGAQCLILDYEISVHVLPASVDDQEVLRIFSRLNSTGSPLNDQELRNAQYHGFFKQCVLNLSIDHFNYWRSWNVFSDFDFARMREVEFTSELVGYILQGMRGRTQTYITSLYKEYEDAFPQEQEVRRRFVQVMERIANDFGDELLRTEFHRTTWFYTLFGEIYDRLFGTTYLDEDDDEYRNPEPITRVFWERVRTVSNNLKNPQNLPVDLMKALTGRTTHIGSRKVRAALLRGDIL